ncbi:hemolysin secretion protein D [Microbulbifer thermotolerans]|uniref:Hemolysin secretion protein D n=2 Tax=Microbulbifer thermotolerans TaxID=252514 RepID=A0A143HJX8_MICTH|nr:hemolysin secretion protein D [Microbulbifer thermotolerans]
MPSSGCYKCLFRVMALCLLLNGCDARPDRALGTLEWNRIALPAPAAEKIIAIEVQQGERVSAGQVLLRLDDRRTREQLAAARAEVVRYEALLEELQTGPRIEEIQRAEASLAAALAEEKEARQNYRRLKKLGVRDYISQSDIDRAEAAADSASASVDSARAALLQLQRGTRSEEIAQAEAALARARAEAEAQAVLLRKLTVQAPRNGLIDNLPFKLGDEAPVGGPLAIMLVGEAPYARVYIPQPLRPGIQVGDPAWVYIDGVEQRFAGRVRMIRSEPSFTPYYALTGDDVARLSYLAEIQLGEDAADFSAGLPLWAVFTQYEEGADDK